MILRNKKTGEVDDFMFETLFDSIKLYRRVGSSDTKNIYNYKFLAELNSEWEDVGGINVTNTPIIKNPKIRKAVKAWSKAEKLKKVFIFNLNVLGKNLIMITEGNNGARKITFKGKLDIAEGFYTIEELCGREE